MIRSTLSSAPPPSTLRDLISPCQGRCFRPLGKLCRREDRLTRRAFPFLNIPKTSWQSPRVIYLDGEEEHPWRTLLFFYLQVINELRGKIDEHGALICAFATSPGRYVALSRSISKRSGRSIAQGA